MLIKNIFHKLTDNLRSNSLKDSVGLVNQEKIENSDKFSNPEKIEDKSDLSKINESFVSSKALTVEEMLNTPEYSNISDEETAKMIGYFSKVLRAKGFPWEYKAKN